MTVPTWEGLLDKLSEDSRATIESLRNVYADEFDALLDAFIADLQTSPEPTEHKELTVEVGFSVDRPRLDGMIGALVCCVPKLGLHLIGDGLKLADEEGDETTHYATFAEAEAAHPSVVQWMRDVTELGFAALTSAPIDVTLTPSCATCTDTAEHPDAADEDEDVVGPDLDSIVFPDHPDDEPETDDEETTDDLLALPDAWETVITSNQPNNDNTPQEEPYNSSAWSAVGPWEPVTFQPGKVGPPLVLYKRPLCYTDPQTVHVPEVWETLPPIETDEAEPA